MRIDTRKNFLKLLKFPDEFQGRGKTFACLRLHSSIFLQYVVQGHLNLNHGGACQRRGSLGFSSNSLNHDSCGWSPENCVFDIRLALSFLPFVSFFIKATPSNISELANTNFYTPRSFHGGFPDGSVVKNLPQCGSHGFSPWVGKITWRRKQKPTPVFLPGWTEELDWLQSMGHKESDITEQLILL